MFIIFSSPESWRPSVVRPSLHNFQRSSSMTLFFPGFVYFMLYEAQISGERLQDHRSSGINVAFKGPSPKQTQNRCRAIFRGSVFVCITK